MRKVLKIIGTEEKTAKDTGKTYYITHCLTQDGDECEYWGDDVKEGDEVMVFFHKGRIKCSKKAVD